MASLKVSKKTTEKTLFDVFHFNFDFKLLSLDKQLTENIQKDLRHGNSDGWEATNLIPVCCYLPYLFTVIHSDPMSLEMFLPDQGSNFV